MYYLFFVCIWLKNSIFGEFSNIYGVIGPKSREVTSQNSTYSKKFPADFDFLCTRRRQTWCPERSAKFHVDTVLNEEVIPEKPRGGGRNPTPPPQAVAG